MEEKHKSQLVAEFSRMIEGERIHVLELPDEYKYIGPELVEQREPSVAAILGSGLNSFIAKARPHRGQAHISAKCDFSLKLNPAPVQYRLQRKADTVGDSRYPPKYAAFTAGSVFNFSAGPCTETRPFSST